MTEKLTNIERTAPNGLNFPKPASVKAKMLKRKAAHAVWINTLRYYFE